MISGRNIKFYLGPRTISWSVTKEQIIMHSRGSFSRLVSSIEASTRTVPFTALAVDYLRLSKRAIAAMCYLYVLCLYKRLAGKIHFMIKIMK